MAFDEKSLRKDDMAASARASSSTAHFN